jgi:hypothetical protein
VPTHSPAAHQSDLAQLRRDAAPPHRHDMAMQVLRETDPGGDAEADKGRGANKRRLLKGEAPRADHLGWAVRALRVSQWPS